MKMVKISVILAFFAFFVSCKTTQKAEKTVTKEQEHHKAHWSYTGETDPKHWSNISETYKACAGHKQSPIDIKIKDIVKPVKPNKLNIAFNTSKTDIINNGHTVQFNVDKGSYVNFNGKKYELKQFHMHSLSEHTVNEKHFPLEIHFVAKADDGTYAVIGVFYKEGEKSPFFTQFLDKLPTKEGDTYKNENTFAISDILPETNHFFHYNGSFTTPPCTEIVDWIILKDAKTASKEQLNKLHNLLHDNFRPVQSLNGRKEEYQ